MRGPAPKGIAMRRADVAASGAPFVTVQSVRSPLGLQRLASIRDLRGIGFTGESPSRFPRERQRSLGREISQIYSTDFGTWHGLLTTPAGAAAIVLGKLASYFVLGLLLFAALTALDWGWPGRWGCLPCSRC